MPVVATHHPADLLRAPEEKARAWADLCLARDASEDLHVGGRTSERGLALRQWRPSRISVERVAARRMFMRWRRITSSIDPTTKRPNRMMIVGTDRS